MRSVQVSNPNGAFEVVEKNILYSLSGIRTYEAQFQMLNYITTCRTSSYSSYSSYCES
jgi:hypothetical protein